MAIDYRIDVQNPFTSALQGFQAAQQIRLQQAQMQQQEAAKQRQGQMQMDLAAFAQREGKTTEDYRRLMMMYPEISKQIQTQLSMINDEQKQNQISQLIPVNAALETGNLDVAKEKIEQYRQAAMNSGDQRQASLFEQLSKQLDIDPAGALESSNIFLSQAMPMEDFERFIKSKSMIKEEQRAQELQPETIKLKRAELVQKGLDQGLTKADVLKRLAETKKLDYESQKLALELDALKKGGQLPEMKEKQFEFERKLAKEYKDNTQNFDSVQEAYRRIQSVEPTAAGDLSLIFSYMKMLDPGSVVREGEFATAQNAAGVPDRIINMYNKILSGERLGHKQRRDFLKQSRNLMSAAAKKEQDVRAGIEKVAKNYQLNTQNIFLTPEVETGAQLPNITSQEEFNALPSGAEYLEDGKKYRKP